MEASFSGDDSSRAREPPAGAPPVGSEACRNTRPEGENVGERDERAPEITELLAAHAAGDARAFERLVPLVYEDLRRIARRQLAGEPEGHTLNTTAIVHEAYLRIAGRTGVEWPDRAHFFAFAARVMRHVLIDYARKRQTQKRGGAIIHVPLDRVSLRAEDPTSELIALDQAITALSERHERMGRVVECKLFAGMTAKDVARALDISLSTVERDWRAAKAYLYRALAPDDDGPRSSESGLGLAPG